MAFLAAEAAPELLGTFGESGGLSGILKGGPGGPGGMGGPGVGELAKHAPMLLMVPLVIFAILFIIIGIIVLAAQKYTAGILLTVLGFLLGGGAFFVMARSAAQK